MITRVILMNSQADNGYSDENAFVEKFGKDKM